MKFFELDKGYILVNEQEEEITVDKHKIFVVPVWKWLLLEKELH